MRVRLPKHLDFIRTLPCCNCFTEHVTQAAHVRMSDARIGKVNPGVGQKPDDFYVVPLCNRCHMREQHESGEGRWWKKQRKDPVLIALALYAVSGDTERALEIINAGAANILAAG